MTISYVTGDATRPSGDGARVICHICNNVGAWGAGFTRALSSRWLEPERLYREHSSLVLGEVMLATVEDELSVANMVAQRGLPTRATRVVVDYSALENCLGFLAAFCEHETASVHMPRIGCGIAGGDWHTVESLIDRTLIAASISVTIYDLPARGA